MSVWPDARVVFVRRRGLENVESRRRKFPEQEFVGHCRDWTDAMLTWHELKGAIPESQRLEIDQHDIVSDRAATTERLAGFLEFDSTQRDRLREYFATSAPERTSADWQPLALDELSWSDDQRAQFVEICGPAMAAFGYSLDRGYWRAASAQAYRGGRAG